MDDSSGDERYSHFHLERPLHITVENEQVRREYWSRHRDQPSGQLRHGRSQAHALSVHRGSGVQESQRWSRNRDLQSTRQQAGVQGHPRQLFRGWFSCAPDKRQGKVSRGKLQSEPCRQQAGEHSFSQKDRAGQVTLPEPCWSQVEVWRL